MKVRMSVVAAGATVVLGATGALVGPAVASAHSASTTLKFTAVQKAGVMFTKTSQGAQETDYNAMSKPIGFDMIYLVRTSTGTAAASITVDIKGGFLYGTATVSKTGVVSNGKVTGGTGAFKGATGTITAKTISSTKHAVTITYSG